RTTLVSSSSSRPPPPPTPFPYTTLFRSPPHPPTSGNGTRQRARRRCLKPCRPVSRVDHSRRDHVISDRCGASQLRAGARPAIGLDRKSTRLNSSHVKISYAVFCLKKKTT